MSKASSSYAANATIFGTQVRADWAADDFGPKEQKDIQRLLKTTGHLAGLRVLEPVCGTGRLTAILAQQVGPSGCVVAMDVSPQMVAAARQRLSGFGNVKIYLGAAEVRAKSLGYFDQVICHQVFPHFIDQAKALENLAGVLNPYGLLVISHFSSFSQAGDARRKAGAVATKEMMPSSDTMRCLCKECGLKIEKWWDDAEGYLLSARLN